MNKDQALALLKLIADLYLIVQAPDPEPIPRVGAERPGTGGGVNVTADGV